MELKPVTKWSLLFWSIFIIFFLVGPMAVSWCTQTASVVYLTGIKLIHALAPSALSALSFNGVLPPTCIYEFRLFDFSVHYIFITWIVSHILAFLIGNFVLRMDQPTMFLSKDYMWLFGKTLLKGAVSAFVMVVLITVLFRIPQVTSWIREYTSIRSAFQASMFFGAIAFALPIISACLKEDQFNFWGRLGFIAELMIFLYEFLFLFFNVDLVVIIMSITIPSFSPEFNPFFPKEWQHWLKEF
jgi:hypothetical protein